MQRMSRFLNSKCLTIALCAVLAVCLLGPFSSVAEENTGLDDGFVNIEDFGAIRDDSKDDSAAIEAALATGKNIYIPQGKFLIEKPIVIEDRIVRGSGSGVATLSGRCENVNDPIMIVKGVSSVTDLYFRYPDEFITSEEKQGERVALQIGDSTRGLEEGSVLRNLFFDMVATAIYCPKDSSCNGVLFETMEVETYCFRGVDMQCENRINNTYSNFYINDQGFFKLVDAGFVLEGSEYGAVINQLNVEHGALRNGIIWRNVKGVNVGAIHFEGIAISQDNMGMLYCENSSGYIANLTTILCFIRNYNTSLVRFGDTETGDVLKIGNINLRGVNQPDANMFSNRPDWEEELGGLSNRGLKTPTAKTFVVFERDNDASGEYVVDIKNYGYYTYHENEIEFWASLPTRGYITVKRFAAEGGADQ